MITLEHIAMEYTVGQPILKDVSLTLERGSFNFLTGASGAGKSTLADLVPRFHDATGGDILIDGKSIKDYSLQSYGVFQNKKCLHISL